MSIATSLDQSFLDDNTNDAEVVSSKKLRQDSEDYNSMLNAFKFKFKFKFKFNDNHTTYDEKFQILTLMPESWSRNRIVNFFGNNCLEYAVRKAVETKKILAFWKNPIESKEMALLMK